MKLKELIEELQKIERQLPFKSSDIKVGTNSESDIFPDLLSGVEWDRGWNTVILNFE